MKIAFIACCKKKVKDKIVPAKDLYISPLFIKSYKYAKEILKAKSIYILSAKHHLVNENKKLEFYDETLNNKKSKEIEKWADEVFKQLKKTNIDSKKDKIYILAGKKYYYKLIPKFEKIGIKYEILMEGKALGERLNWLNSKL